LNKLKIKPLYVVKEDKKYTNIKSLTKRLLILTGKKSPYMNEAINETRKILSTKYLDNVAA